jgi:surface carbohydrate biosynthesis protein
MILLGLELASRDVETALIPLYEQGMDVPLLGLDALVMNFARPANLPLAREYFRLGLPLYVLDTEGGVLSEKGRSSPEAIAASVRDSGFGELLKGYFFWGEALRDAFRLARVLPLERLHLTGCPRFDYYTPAWADLRPPARRKHILVNTNFSVANPRFAGGASSDRAALREVGMEDDYIDRLQEQNRRLMSDMIELTVRLARDLPERHFVVRPHPFERQEAYRDALSGHANVEVDGEGPVLDALRGAHALLHCNCGTAVEALMLGLPPLTPDWLNTDFMRSHAPLPSKASRRVGSYEEMRDLLASPDPAAGLPLRQIYADAVQPYFHRNDGRAAERVAEVLGTQCSDGPRRSAATSLRGSYETPRASQRLQALTANMVGSALVRDLRARLAPARAQKRFRADQVRRDIALLAAQRGLPAPAVRQAPHPLSRLPLSTVLIAPASTRRSR